MFINANYSGYLFVYLGTLKNSFPQLIYFFYRACLGMEKQDSLVHYMLKGSLFTATKMETKQLVSTNKAHVR